jgi:hypothetical protein
LDGTVIIENFKVNSPPLINDTRWDTETIIEISYIVVTFPLIKTFILFFISNAELIFVDIIKIKDIKFNVEGFRDSNEHTEYNITLLGKKSKKQQPIDNDLEVITPRENLKNRSMSINSCNYNYNNINIDLDNYTYDSEQFFSSNNLTEENGIELKEITTTNINTNNNTYSDLKQPDDNSGNISSNNNTVIATKIAENKNIIKTTAISVVSEHQEKKQNISIFSKLVNQASDSYKNV